MIYYDTRLDEWVKDLDTTFIAPELYFEIYDSGSDEDEHTFYVDGDKTETFKSSTPEECVAKYTKLCAKYNKKSLIRKSWGVNSKHYQAGLKHYGLEG